MPAGTVRVYQADSKGGLQFAGEDRIDHTPKDEELTLHIGTAFDLVCDRKQTDFTRVADNVYELAFAIALRNHKTAPVTVEVNEPIAGTGGCSARRTTRRRPTRSPPGSSYRWLQAARRC